MAPHLPISWSTWPLSPVIRGLHSFTSELNLSTIGTHSWVKLGTWVIENNYSTARSTFSRLWVNAHTDERTRFVIADRPQTIVWAFTLSSRTSIWRFMAIWPSVE